MGQNQPQAFEKGRFNFWEKSDQFLTLSVHKPYRVYISRNTIGQSSSNLHVKIPSTETLIEET